MTHIEGLLSSASEFRGLTLRDGCIMRAITIENALMNGILGVVT